MSKVIVYHAGYGCDTGCCGHIVETEDNEQFSFAHPYSEGTSLEFAQQLVAEVLGAEHVADLDWERCEIVDD